MSDRITVTVRWGQKAQKAEHEKRTNLLETLVKEGLANGSFCRNVALCGHCKVRFVKGAPFPSVQDRTFFSPEDLRNGFRLACHAKPLQDCEVELHFQQELAMEIVESRVSQRGEILGGQSEKKSGEILGGQSEKESGEVSDGTGSGNLVAVDIGTTTVVMQMANAVTGEVLGTVKFMNPQRRFGFDVLSRIQAAKEHGVAMRESIVQAILEGIQKLTEQAKCKEPPKLLCVTGNTAMLHIFMGYDTTGLGKSPFRPVSVQCEETLLGGMRTVVMPSVSAFVGADVAAGILTMGMQKTEKIGLLIDLGTNGELALGNAKNIITCATAAGPAFEGGAERGIYAADIIGAIAGLLEENKIEENGYTEKTQSFTYRGKEVEITLEKIREIQLAKAAVRAGIELLVKKYGLSSYEEIDAVYLAGGFGQFLDVGAAVRIGLLPKELEEKAQAVGNSALAGAWLFGRECVKTQKALAKEVDEVLCMGRITSFNLAEEKEFGERYIEHMDFVVKKSSTDVDII